MGLLRIYLKRNRLASYLDKAIIENSLAKKDSLFDLSLRDFIDELSRNSPAPGGGSVSALAGSLSAALVSMVINLSNFKGNYKYGAKAQTIKDKYIFLIEEDSKAFERVMSAFRMKKKSKLDQKERSKAIQNAYKNAVGPPLQMLEITSDVLKIIKNIANSINKNCLSDLGVAIEMIESCSSGAIMNININLEEIQDTRYKNKMNKKVALISDRNDSLLFDLNKK